MNDLGTQGAPKFIGGNTLLQSWQAIRLSASGSAAVCVLQEGKLFWQTGSCKGAACARQQCNSIPGGMSLIGCHTAAEVLLCSCSPIPPFEAFVADLPGPGHSLELPFVCKENSGPRPDHA